MTIPRKDWLELMKIVKEIKLKKEEWLTESELCQLLDIKKSTLISYVSIGKITPDMYKVGIGKTRFYNKEKIMGKTLKL
jgi:hypothetical protein